MPIEWTRDPKYWDKMHKKAHKEMLKIAKIQEREGDAGVQRYLTEMGRWRTRGESIGITQDIVNRREKSETTVYVGEATGMGYAAEYDRKTGRRVVRKNR